MISDSLLASASVVPAASAASVGRSPTAPVIPLSTTSQAIPAASVEASSPSPEYAGPNSATCVREQLLLGPARRQADDPEPVRVLPHQVERLGPDRPGRPQHHHVTSLHRPILPSPSRRRWRVESAQMVRRVGADGVDAQVARHRRRLGAPSAPTRQAGHSRRRPGAGCRGRRGPRWSRGPAASSPSAICAHRLAQDLAAAGLGQAGDDGHVLERRDRADLVAHQRPPARGRARRGRRRRRP